MSDLSRRPINASPYLACPIAARSNGGLHSCGLNPFCSARRLGRLIVLSCGAPADAATKKHHKAAPVASNTQAEIDDLQAKVQYLTDRLDEQAAVSRDALAQLKAAQEFAAQAKATAAAAVATANADDAKI